MYKFRRAPRSKCRLKQLNSDFVVQDRFHQSCNSQCSDRAETNSRAFHRASCVSNSESCRSTGVRSSLWEKTTSVPREDMEVISVRVLATERTFKEKAMERGCPRKEASRAAHKVAFKQETMEEKAATELTKAATPKAKADMGAQMCSLTLTKAIFRKKKHKRRRIKGGRRKADSADSQLLATLLMRATKRRWIRKTHGDTKWRKRSQAGALLPPKEVHSMNATRRRMRRSRLKMILERRRSTDGSVER